MSLLHDDCAVARAGETNEVARVDPRAAKVLRVLQRDPGIILQAFLVPPTSVEVACTKVQRHSVNQQGALCPCLCVNVYGSAELGDRVGEFASQCKINLQDPRHCDRNVEYLNPHRMPLEEVVFTTSLQSLIPQPKMSAIEIREPLDLFRDFGMDTELIETDPSPNFLKVELQSYVK